MEKIWLSQYPADVPQEIDADNYTSLVDLFEQSVDKYSYLPAFINQGRSMTFGKLERRSREFASYLQNNLKLKKGDRVALMMPNLLQYPIALFGALRAGLVVVNVNPLYTPRELEDQLNDSGATTIVIVSNFAHTLEKIVKNTAIEHVILTRIGDQLFFKRPIVNFVVKYIKKLIPKYNLPDAVSFRTALRRGRAGKFTRLLIHRSDLALLQYTGGTTGISKGAMLTHHNLLANVEQAKAVYGSRLMVGAEFIVTALPLYHIFAFTVNCLLFLERGGSNLLITNPRDIKGTAKEMKRYPFTAMTGVNTLFNAFLHNRHFRNLDFSTFHLAVGGGMSVQRSVAEAWVKLTGVHLLEGYGLTECSPLVAVIPYNTEQYTGSIGVPVPSTDIRVVDEQGEDVAQGESGELLVRGPQVMQGYWNRLDETKLVMQDGWLKTGDVVVVDKKGFICIVDRKKDMILVSGFNVYPNEIEDVVMHHPKVMEVAAIGMPSEATGEQVKLYVVKKDPSLTVNELIRFCRKNLTAYKIPKIVEFREELPKSNVGKILRRELRDEAKQALATKDK